MHVYVCICCIYVLHVSVPPLCIPGVSPGPPRQQRLLPEEITLLQSAIHLVKRGGVRHHVVGRDTKAQHVLQFLVAVAM